MFFMGMTIRISSLFYVVNVFCINIINLIGWDKWSTKHIYTLKLLSWLILLPCVGIDCGKVASVKAKLATHCQIITVVFILSKIKKNNSSSLFQIKAGKETLNFTAFR